MKHTLHAEDIMNRHVHGLHADSPATTAVEWLTRRGHSGAPVIGDEGRVEGVFSEYDSIRALLEAVSENRPVGTVAAYMSRDVEFVAPRADITEVASKLAASRHRRVVVVDPDGKVMGLITRSDLIRGLLELLAPQKRVTTYDILQRRWR